MKHFLMFSLVIFVAACSPRQEPLNIAGGTYLGYQHIYFFDRTNRNEMSTEKLNALIARFNDYKNIQAGGPVLQRCDAQEGGV